MDNQVEKEELLNILCFQTPQTMAQAKIVLPLLQTNPYPVYNVRGKPQKSKFRIDLKN